MCVYLYVQTCTYVYLNVYVHVVIYMYICYMWFRINHVVSGTKVPLIHTPTYTHKCTYKHICIHIYTGCHLHSNILVLCFRILIVQNIALMLLAIEFTASSYNLQGIFASLWTYITMLHCKNHPTYSYIIYIYVYVYGYM